MLVKHTPDAYEKLQLLGGMATDDILYPQDGRSGNRSRAMGRAGSRPPYSSQDKNPIPGVYRAAMPNGKYINLMRVMFTDFCMLDCAYCPNSIYVPRKRYAFKVEELARTFMELHQRHTVAGLFLSSGIAGSGSKTMERLIQVVEIVRHKYGFKGYVHLKVMPGAEYQYVEAAHRLGTRLSVNIETPTAEMMRKLTARKDLDRDILAPMGWIDKLTRSAHGAAVGQATQFVVGAADESDADILRRIDQLYTDWTLKRVYYSAFRPVRYTPLEEHPATLLLREHRLYQMDWLKRVYRFSMEELNLAFDKGGFLSLEQDPKTLIALANLDAFPVDVNGASREQLLRVPGVGPTAVQRIVQTRRRHSVDTWRDLQAMGVVRKRAWPFLAFPGQRLPRGKQLKLELFRAGLSGEQPQRKTASPRSRSGASPVYTPATCGQTSPRSRSGASPCAACPMYGMPGHPGSVSWGAAPTSGAPERWGLSVYLPR